MYSIPFLTFCLTHSLPNIISFLPLIMLYYLSVSDAQGIVPLPSGSSITPLTFNILDETIYNLTMTGAVRTRVSIVNFNVWNNKKNKSQNLLYTRVGLYIWVYEDLYPIFFPDCFKIFWKRFSPFHFFWDIFRNFWHSLGCTKLFLCVWTTPCLYITIIGWYFF